MVHVSFQSTGRANISTVNCLSKVHLYVQQRLKGQGKLKYVWGIEMNEGHECYINTYSAVDKIHQMLKNGDSVMYLGVGGMLQCGIGRVLHSQCPTKCTKCVLMAMLMMSESLTDGPEYGQILGKQMCIYHAKDQKYPIDDF